MIEWVSLKAGTSPVPRPVATPVVWATAVGGALVLVALQHLLLGPDRPGFALVALSLLAGLLGLCSRFTAAPGTAVLCWLFLNGFAIPPEGTLSWAGHRDTFWLTCLCGATLLGTILARLVHARAAYSRVTASGVASAAEPDDWPRPS
ncbi:hypothetical protein ACIPPJ_25820 [Streptomyces sp. NPDC086091]|uniref:hypothetical protein n=1 Tax=unclassified Streptomyces TaxID=2593676 RepID=UPI0037FE2950